MGLISPGGENFLDFLELQQVLSTYDGDIRDPLLWPHERPVPMRVARGPLGIPLPSMPGPKNGPLLNPLQLIKIERVYLGPGKILRDADWFCLQDPLNLSHHFFF